MEPFVYDAVASRVLFGAGSIDRVADEVESLGFQRVFLIADHGGAATADRVSAALGSRVAVRWNEVIQHVPVELAERARAEATSIGADGLVTIGGGSSTGLAKILALSHGLSIVAVPTTYAGSEMTPIYGSTGGRHKETGRNASIQPRVVVYDPAVTVGLPASVTGPSAFNALAHCIEALWVKERNPVISALALEGIRAIARSLPVAIARPDDLDGRSELLLGAYLAGLSLGATSTGMHHKICHVLGGSFNLVHADAHSVILPHVVAFNAPAIPAAMARLAEALGDPDVSPARQLWRLAKRSGVPTDLAALGLGEGDLHEAAQRATHEITDNPVPVDEAAVERVLRDAFMGSEPDR